MKKITVTLSDKAEKYFNELMYSLPKEADGSGMATQSDCINYVLETAADIEAHADEDIVSFFSTTKQLQQENERLKQGIQKILDHKVLYEGGDDTDFDAGYFSLKIIAGALLPSPEQTTPTTDNIKNE